MLAREGWVKGLDAKPLRVARELIGSHQRDRSKSANIAVVKRPTVAKPKLDRGVTTFDVGQPPVIDQEGAGESGLNHQAVASREIEDDELCAAPRTMNR